MKKPLQILEGFFFIRRSIASGGYLSCFGKKDTKEADQGEALRVCSRKYRRRN